MTTPYKFPAAADRRRIHTLIAEFAHGKITLTKMFNSVAEVVRQYPRLSRIPIYGYSVRILQTYNGLPIVSITSAKLSDTCPCCNAGEQTAGYLRTEKEQFNQEFDLISVTCLECGTVYFAHGRNGRRQEAYV